MTDVSEGHLRELIRFIPPARALREDLEKSLHLEHFEGTGDTAVKTFTGLQASVAAIANNPYVASLALEVPGDADDKAKVSVVSFAAGQLLAYLEGQTGLSGVGGNTGTVSYQTAPNIAINNIKGLPDATIKRMLDLAADDDDGDDE